MQIKIGFSLLFAAFALVACGLPREPSHVPNLGGDGDNQHVSSPPKKDEPGKQIVEADRWVLSDPHAIKALRETPFGEREIREFWTRKGWRMTKKEERYIDETKSLLARGVIEPASHWAMCPYTPVYRAREATTVMGTSVAADQEFHFEMCENENEVQLARPHFKRVKGYQEDHADGHATDPSKKPHD